MNKGKVQSWMGIGALGVAACFMAGAAGAIDIKDYNRNDLNFYEIWNTLYEGLDGQSSPYGTSNDVYVDWGVDLFGGEDLFSLVDPISGGSFGFEAVFAANNQTFGWYDPNDPEGSKEQLGQQNGVFSLLGGTPSGDLTNPPADVFGFYLTTTRSSVSNTWYSESSRNPDGNRQLAIFRTPGDGFTKDGERQYDFLLAWEDINVQHGDKDFTDLVVGVSGVQLGTPVVPEPATMTLLGLGLAGMLLARFRTKRS